MHPADQMGMKLWGRTRQDAWDLKLCIKCTVAPNLVTRHDEKEYGTSALCPICWDELFADVWTPGDGDPVPPPGG